MCPQYLSCQEDRACLSCDPWKAGDGIILSLVRRRSKGSSIFVQNSNKDSANLSQDPDPTELIWIEQLSSKFPNFLGMQTAARRIRSVRVPNKSWHWRQSSSCPGKPRITFRGLRTTNAHTYYSGKWTTLYPGFAIHVWHSMLCIMH